MIRVIILLIFITTNLNALGIKIGSGISIPKLFLNNYYKTTINFNSELFFKTSIKNIKILFNYSIYNFSNLNTKLNINTISIGGKVGDFLKIPINPYIKIEVGINFETLYIEKKHYKNYDPIFSGGVGIDILKNHLIYIESVYSYIFQKSQMDAETNGSVLNINFGISFKI